MTVEQWLGADNAIGIQIWNSKYRRGEETFDQWLDRVSGGDRRLRQMIAERKLLPAGRVLSNRGVQGGGSMTNCHSRGYVQDCFEDIMQAAVDIGTTYKAQGGQGLSLSKLRPKGAPIRHGMMESDGIVPFMRIYNEVTAGVSQGGARKGALLISLDAWHPEAETFIRIKSETGQIEKANLSLELDDEFMRCVKQYYQTGERVSVFCHRDYDGGSIDYEVTPIDLYKLMCRTAWDWAEPGCIFTERFRNYNFLEKDDNYQIETGNPCGEQPLPPHGSCNLLSINLDEFVLNPFTKGAIIDWEGLTDAVRVGVDTLDLIIDENVGRYPLAQQEEMALKWRNAGLGVMGYADMLMKLRMVYGSERALYQTKHLFSFIMNTAVQESIDLAKRFGPYPAYSPVVWDSTILRSVFPLTSDKRPPLRNCSLISIAPTGSLATMLGVSGGGEPEFALRYTRRTIGLSNGEEQLHDIHCKVVRDYFDYLNGLDDRGNTADGKELPRYFVCAADISPEARVRTQAAMQEYTDAAISSTVNLPESATVEDVERLFLQAWQEGLKGITIYRAGCKRTGILVAPTKDGADAPDAPNAGDTPEDAAEDAAEETIARGVVLEAGNDAIGRRRKLTTGCGSLYLLAYFDPVSGDLLETYLAKGSSGGCINSMTGLSRMISLAARGGVTLDAIVDQLGSTGSCPSYVLRRVTKGDASPGACCPMAIGNALMEMWNEVRADLLGDAEDATDAPYTEDAAVPAPCEPSAPAYEQCPICGERLYFEGGCNICKSCGWSRCS